MLSQLRDIVEHVSRVDDVYQALDVFVKETRAAINTECCTVYLSNDSKHRLELMATQGLIFEGRSIHIDFNEGLVGQVFRTAEPLNLASASTHKNFKFFPELGEDIYHAFLGTPIIYRKQVLGVVVIQQKQVRQFSEMEESFLVTLAAQLAVIIAHSREQGHWLLEENNEYLQGIPASPGVAIGPLWWDDTQPSLTDVYPASTLNVGEEIEWLTLAIESAVKDFRRMRKKLDSDINKETLAIFDLFTHLLNDPMLRSDLKAQIQKGDRADWALRQVVESYSNRFAKMSDLYLRERAQDIKELGQRLLYFLYNSQAEKLKIEQPIILVVPELTATLLAALPKDKVLGVISLEGAANSHAAILSRALGIPAVMGVNLTSEMVSADQTIIDGYSGEIILNPPLDVLTEYSELMSEEVELSELVNDEIAETAQTKDLQPVSLLLNAGLSADTGIAINQGVDGVGLYRTEISFLLKQRFPSEEEQTHLYRNVLSMYHGKSVVMRTLDVGGDKSLPYLPIEEENPFLGWRGIRFTLDHPDIFLIQLRAMLKASIGLDNLKIMLPMISSAQELDDAMRLIEQAIEEVSVIEPTLSRPAIGIMIEVPSMLFILPQLAHKIDFVSIGTNDLTQYLLAVDRNNAKVSGVYESVHPALLIALSQIKQVCDEFNLPVSICGELAGDPIGALLLIGLGYRTLSMNTANVAKIKYVLRQCEANELTLLAEQSLKQPYAKVIYNEVFSYLEQKQLAGFVRAGKK